MTLDEKFALTEKKYTQQRQFERKLEIGCCAALLFVLMMMPVSYKIAYPTKRCVVKDVDSRNKEILAQDIKDANKYYTIYYWGDDAHENRVSESVKYGDTLRCVGPRNSSKYFFSCDVTGINGVRTQKYLKNYQQRTK